MLMGHCGGAALLDYKYNTKYSISKFIYAINIFIFSFVYTEIIHGNSILCEIFGPMECDKSFIEVKGRWQSRPLLAGSMDVEE